MDPAVTGPADAALVLRGVGLDLGGRTVLDGVDWTVAADQRWVVLGRNGSGKTSLVRIASLWQHPTRGVVEVLGERLGHTDVRPLRARVGLASAGLADRFRGALTPVEIVMMGRTGALEPWWHDYSDADRHRARAELDRMGVGHTGDQPFATLSSGERQRVLLARTLVTDPGLVLLDEPTAALDLGGREELVATLDALAADPTSPPTVLVTHHVEEIPPRFTHVLLLAGGGVQAAGPIDEVLTSAALSACFGVTVELHRHPRTARLHATAP